MDRNVEILHTHTHTHMYFSENEKLIYIIMEQEYL